MVLVVIMRKKKRKYPPKIWEKNVQNDCVGIGVAQCSFFFSALCPYGSLESFQKKKTRKKKERKTKFVEDSRAHSQGGYKKC